MRIAQLTPGTGNFYCGSCLRDSALVGALKRLGHSVDMIPMYLPHVTEHPDGSENLPIFFGGINVYLQQKNKLFRHTPRWMDAMLDRQALLVKAADRAGMTAAKDLGELTVSMLAGEEGQQNKELSRLIRFLRGEHRPEIVSLSNAMLIGVARRIRNEVGCPVVCTLAGEDSFLDSLIEPYRTRAWELLIERASDVDAFIAVSRYYGDEMMRRMNLPADRVHVVHNGIDVQSFEFSQDPRPMTIGYLARMHPAKGLDALVETFIELRAVRKLDCRLCIIGACTPSDELFVGTQMQRLREAGLLEYAEFHRNASPEDKRRLLKSLAVLSVPATYGESFGLYVLEAWASGVPVVQPRHAAFPEIVDQAEGGLLHEPGDLQDHADALQRVLTNADLARQLAANGRRSTEAHYNLDRMARQVSDVLRQAAAVESEAKDSSR